MALLFDADSEEIDYGSGPVIGTDANFTILMWVYPTVIDNIFRQIGGNTTSGGSNHRVATSDNTGGSGRIRCALSNDGTNPDSASDSGTLTLNEWNFIAFRYDTGDSQEVRLYRGDLDALITEVSGYSKIQNGSGSTRAGTGNFILGSDPTNSFGHQGRIATFMLWPSTALTLDQIQTQQFRPHVTLGCEIYSQVGWTGTTTQADWSGSGNQGTITGATIADHVPLGAPFGSDIWIPSVVALSVPPPLFIGQAIQRAANF